MRIVILLLIILFSSKSFSQNGFTRGLLSIVNDSENGFQNFRGSFKESPDSSLKYYYSVFTLQGTSQNYIVHHRYIDSYDAIVCDSVNEKKGEEILDMWNVKVSSTLSGEFRLKENKILAGSPFVAKWEYERGNVSVFIGLSQYINNPSIYAVMLYVSHEILR